MVRLFKRSAEEKEGDEDAISIHNTYPCKVWSSPLLTYLKTSELLSPSSVVCASANVYNTPVKLGSYFTVDSVDIDIGLQTYVDGASGHKNPVKVIWSDATSLWAHLSARIRSV